MGYIDDAFFRFFNPISRKKRTSRKRVRRVVRRRPVRRAPRKRVRRVVRRRPVRRAPRKRVRRVVRKRVRRVVRRRPVRRAPRKRPVRRVVRKRVRRVVRRRPVRRAPRKRVVRRLPRKPSGLLRVVDVWNRHLENMKARVRVELSGSRYTEKAAKVHFPTEYMTPGGWMTDNPSQYMRKRCMELILYYTYYTIEWRKRNRTMTASVEYHVGQYRMRSLPIRPDKINLDKITEAFKDLTKTRFSEVSRTKDSMFVVMLQDGLGYYVTVW
jgi:hypothetical protein